MIFTPLFDLVSSEGPSVGIELEFYGGMPAPKAVQVAKLLMQHKMLSIKTSGNTKSYVFTQNGEELEGLSAVNAAIIHGLNTMYPNLWYKPVHCDPTVSKHYSIELAFRPMSLDALNSNKEPISQVLEILKNLNYTVNPDCGMHLWYDYEFFGNTSDEMLRTMEKFYIFLFRANSIVDCITERPTYTSSFNADIRAMLGDPLRLNEDLVMNQFVADKKSFVKNFQTANKKLLWNIEWGKNGTKAAEFRWCAGQDSFDRISAKNYSILHIIEFCKEASELEITKANYLDFLNAKLEGHIDNRAEYKTVKNMINEIY